MDSGKLALKLRLAWIGIYVIAGITILLYETGVLQKGSVTDNGTIYILQVIAVMVSLAVIPLALRGFKRMMERMEDKPFRKRLGIYMTFSWLRLAAFFLVVEYSVLLYYLINDDIGLYCGVIGAICSMFCIPSRNTLEYETDWEEEE